MTVNLDDVHDLPGEPGRVSVLKNDLQVLLDGIVAYEWLVDHLNREIKVARSNLDEARKELVRERALHRLEIAEQVIDPTEYW